MTFPDTRSLKCGFIGLGSQGGPMARRMIDAGYPVTLWARRAESLTPYADTRATIAPDIAALGRSVDHVGICVVDDAGVQQICDALIPAMRSGSSIAIHSTVNPQLCVSLAAAAALRGIALIDAPVSGGGGGAAAGSLTVMVGGDKQAVDAVRPVFETFAGLIVHLGGVGAGQRAKLVNNAMMAANLAIAHHALTAGGELGLDRKALIDLIKVSSGRSFGFEVYARLPTPQAFAHGAKLLVKDVRLLEESLDDSTSMAALRDIALPVLDLALNP
jgi:3-hydroxyisobutyrate dehydrogenase-like beta-hydroxyacid dehydrogenase